MEKMKEIIQKVWPEWKVIEEIGEGGYGTVYKVVREGFAGTTYAAIKVTRIPRTSSEIEGLYAEGMTRNQTLDYYQGIVRDYAAEIKLMDSVKGYTNIVSIDDYQVYKPDNEMVWYVLIRMELLTPLMKKIGLGSMDEQEIIRLGIDICNALDICGRYHIVHRDIKPENIFINDGGDYKLGDFGVARNLEKITMGLSRKGTPNYMAPEVHRSITQEIDFAAASKVDIYSLGMVLYWLGNGSRLPFLSLDKQLFSPKERETAFIRRVSGEQLQPPAKVSPAFQQVILKACAYDPKDRYESAAELRTALQGLQKGKQQTEPKKDDIKQSKMAEGPAEHNTGNTDGDLTVNIRTERSQQTEEHKTEISKERTAKGYGRVFIALVAGLVIVAVLWASGIFKAQTKQDEPNQSAAAVEESTADSQANKSDNTSSSTQTQTSKTAQTGKNKKKELEDEYYPDGKIKKKYILNERKQVARINNYNRYGAITLYEIAESWDYDGNILTSTEYEPGTLNRDYEVHNSYAYDENGNTIRRISSDKEGTIKVYSNWSKELDANGRIIKTINYDETGNVHSYYENYEYDENDHVLGSTKLDSKRNIVSTNRSIWENGVRIEYTETDLDGNVITHTVFDPVYGDPLSFEQYNDDGSTWKGNISYGVNTYEKDEMDISENYKSRTVTSFDTEENLLKKVSYKYDESNKTWVYDAESKYDTLSNGHTVETKIYVDGKKDIRESDENGKTLKSTSTYYNADGSFNFATNDIYNEDGSLHKTDFLTETGELEFYSVYEYDNQGRTTKDTVYRADGSINWEILYRYLEDGTCQQKMNDYDSNGVLKEEGEWK